jgi:penicillin-binding protein 2
MIDKEEEKAKSFTRRAFVIGALQGSLLAVLGGRLAWLQLAQGGKYKTLSDKNRINIKMIAPSRGEIFDRFGVPLAVNAQNFRVLMVPEQTDNVEQSLNHLAKLIDLDDRRIQKILEDSKKSASFVPLEVTDNLSWKDIAKLEVNVIDLPGMSIDEGEIRSYPFAESTAHLVGYVGSVSQTDLAEDDPALTLPGFRIGKTAIEKSFDNNLRGKIGTTQREVNVRGREVRELETADSTNGQRVTLSIDAELQRYCQERLAQHKSASAIVMDSKTGAIYALASHPSFDPNLFTRGISAEQWEELLANPAFPLNNKAVSGQYPPGSTFKMITALAALEHGIAKAGTIVNCTGRYELGSDTFRCWKLSGHGITTVTSALMKSCDTWFYKLSTEIGIDNIARMAERFGLGQKYDFDIQEERAGLMPDKDWKMARYGQVWRPGETIVASIGQGSILATPLQLAVMTSRLVNGGYAVKPWLVGYVGSEKKFQDQWPKIDVSQRNLNLIKKGMDRVVNDKDGTAYAARIEEKNQAFGGKTGTAQVKRINREQYAQGIKNEDLEWKYRHHALFVGYAPLNNPRYVCSVVVEHGGGGSAVAAPLARDILKEVQVRDPAKEDINLALQRKMKAYV